MSKDDPFSTILIHAWPGLTEVRLYDSTWNEIIEKHPELSHGLPSQRLGLEDGIANPMLICESKTDPKGSVVIVSYAFMYLGDPVVVPVRLVGPGTSGRVVTGYFDSTGYGGGKVLWSAGDE